LLGKLSVTDVPFLSRRSVRHIDTSVTGDVAYIRDTFACPSSFLAVFACHDLAVDRGVVVGC
jgi:hypothetical protein